MISLSETVTVKATKEEAFRFVADFTSAAEWDPQVVSAQRMTDGVIGAGTKFALRFRVGPKVIPLVYEITNFEPPSELMLVGTGPGFEGTDRIVFESADTGTRISYTADLEFAGSDSILKPFITRLMQPMGKNAVEGLRRCLDHSLISQTGLVETMADRLLVPALVGFSEVGYRLRDRHASPIDGRLDGKLVVITGVTSGLGAATSKAVADLGAKVALIGRDRVKLEAIRAELETRTGRQDFTIFEADLSEPGMVGSLCDDLCRTYDAIDVLIHNAGMLAREYRKNSEGTEQSVAVNLIAPQIMTARLAASLKATGQARVIFVSSGGMYPVRLSPAVFRRGREEFDGIEAYAQAKRAQVVLAEIWGEAFRSDQISVHAMHPGWADTPGVERSLPAFYRLTKPILRSPQHGADTIVWLAAASEPARSTGLFWHDRRQRQKYLIPGTRETQQEREKLLDFLQENARDNDDRGRHGRPDHT
jgi:NAD(P)-dependent dehydrogenase (short-subunit alcohol dehydrogenase family)